MSQQSYTLRRRLPDRTLGEVFTDVEMTWVERFNLPSTLQVTGSTDKLRAVVSSPAGGVVLEDEEGQAFSGVLTNRERNWDSTCTLTFTDDLLHLWGRICYPNPANSWVGGQGSVFGDTRTGPVETVVLGFIDANAGPGARDVAGERRRVPGLVVPASAGRGPSRPLTARTDNLGVLMSRAFEIASLRLRVEHVGTNLNLVVDAAQDLSGDITYGTDDQGGPGSLSGQWSLNEDSPSLTAALMAGSDEDINSGVFAATRQRADGTAESLWGRRIERFFIERQDRAAPDRAALDAAGDEQLAQGAAGFDLSDLKVESRPGFVLRSDIPVGSLVGVTVDGTFTAQRLREITTTITGEQVSVAGLVGTVDAGKDELLKRLEYQLQALGKSTRS